MNFVTAIVLFTVVALIGMPKVLDNQFTVASDTHITKRPKNEGVVKIGSVVQGSPAAKIGLKPDVRILSINTLKVTSPESLSAATKANAGKPVRVVTDNGKTTRTYVVTLNTHSPYLGVGSYTAQEGLLIRRSTWSAPIVAFGVTWNLTVATVNALGTAVHGLGAIIAGFFTGNTDARRAGQSEAGSKVSGPVGIFAILKGGASQGIGFVLFIIGVVSLSLAIMNILPIPALDGGKLAITYASRLFGKRVSETFENYAYGISFMLLIGLMVVVTFVDVKRFF
jgi:regulator of sigma E protease